MSAEPNQPNNVNPVNGSAPAVDTSEPNCINTPAQQAALDLLALAARVGKGAIFLPPSGQVTPETGWYICATGEALAQGMELQLLYRVKSS